MGDSKREFKTLPGNMGDFSRLPTEVMEDVLPFYLSNQEMAFFSATSRSSLKTLENQLEERQMKRLVHHVIIGDCVGAERILRDSEKRLSRISKASGMHMQEEAKSLKDRHLLKIRLRVEDLSGRVFENITLFEYAIWAKDVRMILIFLKFLPREEALCQFKKMRANINLKKEEKESGYNPCSLFEAHDALVDCAEEARAAGVMVEEKRVSDSLDKVRQAQRMLPVCFVLDLCGQRNIDLSAPVWARWRNDTFNLNHCAVSEKKILSKWFDDEEVATHRGSDFKRLREELKRTGFISPDELMHLAYCLTVSSGIGHIDRIREIQLNAIETYLGGKPRAPVGDFYLSQLFQRILDDLFAQENFVAVFGTVQNRSTSQYSPVSPEGSESVLAVLPGLPTIQCRIS